MVDGFPCQHVHLMATCTVTICWRTSQALYPSKSSGAHCNLNMWVAGCREMTGPKHNMTIWYPNQIPTKAKWHRVPGPINMFLKNYLCIHIPTVKQV